MSKSLFRWYERLLLFICYFICYAFNILFDYIRILPVDSLLLEIYLKQFYDYQTYIMFAISFILIIFHYKMLNSKKNEIYCRYIVGGNLESIASKYALDCLIVWFIAFILSYIIVFALGLNIINNIYLSCPLLIYILFSSRKVGNFESF